MKNEVTDYEYRERLEDIMSSLKTQQERLWELVGVRNSDYAECDKSNICEKYLYRKRISDLMSQIAHLKSLEMALRKLFDLNDPEINSIDELTKDVAQVYCTAW